MSGKDPQDWLAKRLEGLACPCDRRRTATPTLLVAGTIDGTRDDPASPDARAGSRCGGDPSPATRRLAPGGGPTPYRDGAHFTYEDER